MTENIKQPWILEGYELFSREGSKGLKIEVISRKVKKSKSSFYHLFADIDCFTEELLSFHLERAKIIADKERLCKSIDPALINLLLEAKQDLLFNRQLRVNRTNPAFKQCFEKANQLVGNAFLEVWAKEIGLENKPKLAEIFFGLVLENFYLQTTVETLTYEWLSDYFKNIRLMVTEFNKEMIEF
jgi:AcrR family transcriptional regulator